MNDINKTVIIGRLTRDPDSNYTASGFFVCKLSIAVNYSKKNGDNWDKEVSFFDVTFLGKRAEGLFQYLQKGKQICIEGELRQDRWEQDGAKRSRVVILASNIQLLGGNENTESNNNTPKPPTNPPVQKPQQNSLFTPPPNTPSADADEFEDDIPF